MIPPLIDVYKRQVSFLSWRRNRLNCLLPRLVSGEGEAESLRSSRAFSTQLIPQFLTVEGEGQAYHLNCLLACISTGIALEEVLFPVKEEKTEYRIPEFLKSIKMCIRDSAPDSEAGHHRWFRCQVTQKCDCACGRQNP